MFSVQLTSVFVCFRPPPPPPFFSSLFSFLLPSFLTPQHSLAVVLLLQQAGSYPPYRHTSTLSAFFPPSSLSLSSPPTPFFFFFFSFSLSFFLFSFSTPQHSFSVTAVDVLLCRPSEPPPHLPPLPCSSAAHLSESFMLQFTSQGFFMLPLWTTFKTFFFFFFSLFTKVNDVRLSQNDCFRVCREGPAECIHRNTKHLTGCGLNIPFAEFMCFAVSSELPDTGLCCCVP